MRHHLLLSILTLPLALASGGAQAQRPRSAAKRVTPAVAQEPDTSKHRADSAAALSPAPPMAPRKDSSVSAPQLPPRGTYTHTRPIEEKYDRFAGNTRVMMPRGASGVPGLDLLAFFLFDGEKIAMTARPIMSLMFSATSDEWQYLHNHDVTFLLDGKTPLHPKLTRHDGRVGRGYVLEFIDVMLTRDQAATLTAANKIEVQIGSTEGTLNDDTTQALKDLASRMQPAEP